jgi:hypothetical protein
MRGTKTASCREALNTFEKLARTITAEELEILAAEVIKEAVE